MKAYKEIVRTLLIGTIRKESVNMSMAEYKVGTDSVRHEEQPNNGPIALKPQTS